MCAGVYVCVSPSVCVCMCAGIQAHMCTSLPRLEVKLRCQFSDLDFNTGPEHSMQILILTWQALYQLIYEPNPINTLDYKFLTQHTLGTVLSV